MIATRMTATVVVIPNSEVFNAAKASKLPAKARPAFRVNNTLTKALLQTASTPAMSTSAAKKTGIVAVKTMVKAELATSYKIQLFSALFSFIPFPHYIFIILEKPTG
ncbi:hypothetical protein SDC9_186565 [bioreactor metagenome]|uniref:Uncharacterized protein n=1 Tax=bioreactor metagenome TaxID=1076179 RepID=A0A645HLD4_9ZZZZ